MKKILSLTLAVVMVLGLIPLADVGAFATDTVTLSSGGDLNAAINNVEDGGTVTISGTYTLPSGFSWASHGKSVTITGGTLDASALSTLTIGDSVTFDDLTVKFKDSSTVYANGNALKINSNVTVNGTVSAIYGGGNGNTVASTDITLLSGNYKAIYGGSNKGTVTGDTNVYVGGTANSACDAASHSATYTVYGGGNGDKIGGDTHLTVADSMKANYIYGGSVNSGATIGGTAYLSAEGGTVMSIYGAGKNVDCVKNTVATVTGGTFEQVFGGAESSAVTGDVLLRVWGGTISRRIYGGCYNECTRSGLSVKWSSSNGVSGTIKLVIGSGAKITFTSQDNDKAIYARSRQKSDVDGTAILIFSDPSVSVKTGAQDFVMQLIMGSASVQDKKYTLSHSVSGNVITETGGPSTETATLTLDTNASLQYDGSEKTPVSVVYSEGWLGEPLSDISYKNNVNVGEATASATLECESLTATLSFDIWEPSTDMILAIANGTSDRKVSLNSSLSFSDIPVSGETLAAIVKAVEQGKIALNGYALTDLVTVISTKEELSSIREYTQGTFILSGSIDMSGTSLSSPALTLCNSTLDGRGYAIYGYSVNGCGLIGISATPDNEVTVSSLRLGKADAKIAVSAASEAYAAALVGTLPSEARLSLDKVSAYVNAEGGGSLGGIIGKDSGNVIFNKCAVYGGIASTNSSAGGFIAVADGQIELTDSVNKSTVTGSYAGGAIGKSSAVVSIVNFINDGNVSGSVLAGGITGSSDNSLTAKTVLNTGKISSTAGRASAIIGYTTGNATVEYAVNAGEISSATGGTGMIVGYTDGSALTVKNCVASGKASGNTDTQIVFGGSPVLEDNYAPTLKNSNANTTALNGAEEFLGILNAESSPYYEAWGRFMLGSDKASLVLGTPSVYGVQQSEVSNKKFSVRFIVVINDTLDYSRLGLTVQAGDGAPMEFDSPYVFTTLLETTNGGYQTEIGASDIGGAYLYAVNVNNIPVSGIEADGSVTLTVTPYAVDKSGNRMIGDTVSVTYVNGEIQKVNN